MKTIRHEIYDENGLLHVEFVDVDEPTQEELIAEKESQLIAIYEEIKSLKNGK